MKYLIFILGFVIGLSFCGCRPSASDDGLFLAYDVSKDSIFMPWAGGLTVDTQGTVYAVNIHGEGTIGTFKEGEPVDLFLKLPHGSVGNGIRFWNDRMLLVADCTLHNILAIDIPTREMWIWAHCPKMARPSDLALMLDGTLFVSDPDWEKGTGKLWKVFPDGRVTLLEEGMGITNGLEVSPDERHLFVNESNKRKIWVYDIMDDGTIENKRLFIQFRDFGLNGMSCDAQGNLYVARFDKGTIAIVSPKGKVKREVKLKGMQPTNIAFGGKEGKTVFVTMADRGCIEAFKTDFSGRSQLLMDTWKEKSEY